MKFLHSIFKSNSRKCPYCEYKFKEIPKMNVRCPECNNTICLLKSLKGISLITEEERLDRDTFTNISKVGFEWDMFIHFKKNFFQNASENKSYNDFLWSLYEYLLNEKARTEEFNAMKILSELMAELAKENTKQYLEYKKQAYLMQLYDAKKTAGPDGFVEIRCSDNACEACKELSKSKIPIEDAIEDPPLPNKRCAKQECNCIMISKPLSSYLVKGAFSLGAVEEQYKNLRFYLTKWHKKDGDFVKRGEIIFTLEDADYSPLVYNGEALCDGVLEILEYASSWRNKVDIISGQILYAIHKNPEQSKIQELIDKRFENKPLIAIDDFTGEKAIKWESVFGNDKKYSNLDYTNWWDKDCFELGREILYFTINNLSGKDYIIFRYFPKEFNLPKGSKVSFLFESNDIIEFIINDKPYELDKVYVSDRKIKLNEAKVLLKQHDLDILKRETLLKWKIEIGKSGRVIEDIIDSSDLKHSIKNLAIEYHEIVKKEIGGAIPDESFIKPDVSMPNLEDYNLPSIDILKEHKISDTATANQKLEENKQLILRTLKDFDIDIDKIEAIIGPTVTLYELTPARGTRLSKIKNLEDDITLALSALGIRISAPLPGKGTVGIEVPNKKPSIVSFKSVVESDSFIDSDFELPLALGRTIDNKPYIVDLNKMPHILMAGATGQGKSVGLNVIITSLLYKKKPSEVKLILVDPKKVEFTVFNEIKDHFLIRLNKRDKYILTESDEIVDTLNSLCAEMDNRFLLLQDAKVKNIKEYNKKLAKIEIANSSKKHGFMPYIVLVIDEFADLMLGGSSDVEKPIIRLAQLARAVGIHLIIATQRPSVNIITGLIKANFPARIAYRVASRVDSRTILDSSGAEKLIGRGDMLFSEGADFVRLQSPFISTEEIENVVKHISNQKA